MVKKNHGSVFPHLNRARTIQERTIAPESRASGLQARALASPRLGSEVKFGFSFHFFYFLGGLEGLAEIKCRAPHAIDAVVCP